MKKIFFLTTLLIIFLNGISQTVETNFVLIPDFLELKGKIDSKYNITMRLFPFNSQVNGSYSYDNVKKKITLHGKINYVHGTKNGNYYEKQELELLEYDKNNNKRAKFIGVINNDSIFNGVWKDLKENKKLPFKLSITSYNKLLNHNRYILELKYKFETYFIDYSENFKYKPKIDTVYSISNDNKIHSIILARYPSSGGCYNTGSCGCGAEKFLIYVTVDKTNESISSQIIYYHSCITPITFSLRKDGRQVPPGQLNLKDFKRLRLIVRKVADTENIYILKNKCLECGFQLKQE